MTDMALAGESDAQAEDAIFPRRGRDPESILAEIDRARADDVDWRHGKFHGVCYYAGDSAVDVAQKAFLRYWFVSAHAGAVFPSVRNYESDLVAMGSRLLNAPDAHGVVTTGGTESNLLAVWAALTRFAKCHGSRSGAKVVLPYSAHPSLVKAVRYFGVEAVTVPTDPKLLTADPGSLKGVIDDSVALVVASAPSYAHGVVDPITEIAEITQRHNVPLHVDACVGGFILPFVERLGRPMPVFDFRVAGVTSMSADLHKQGFAPRPISLVLFRDEVDVSAVNFEFFDWPMGRYFSQGIAGSRSAGAVAGAWAVLQHLGEEGFLSVTREVMRLRDELIAGIERIPGLHIHGQPVANKFGYGSDELDIFAVGAALEEKGWKPGLQGTPKGINIHMQLFHEESLGRYLEDLAEAADLVRAGEVSGDGQTAAYN